MTRPHIINVSGGKDSTATYLLALERRERTGKPFRAVMADTGHEARETYEYAQSLATRTGGPKVEMVRADFSARMAFRRGNLRKLWEKAGVPEDRIARAQEMMRPTGNPFLDLCILKGRFPSARVRFCTEELKHRPVIEQVVEPALREAGRVVQWLGVRRDESRARADTPDFRRIRWENPPGQILMYYPIASWTAGDVFAQHRKHGLDPNPLYLRGFGRVGCWPCIMARKDELAHIATQAPEAFEKLREWEALVAEASKRGAATFFGPDKTPRGAAMAKAGIKGGADGAYPDALEIADWARDDRGGQANWLRTAEIEETAKSCNSIYAGLCE